MSERVIDGERGVSEVKAPPRINRRHGAALIALAGGTIAMYLIVAGSHTRQEQEAPPPPLIGPGQPFEPARQVRQEPPPTQPQRQDGPPPTQAQAATADPLEKARAAFPFGEKDRGGQAPQAAQQARGADGAPVQQVAARESELASKLHATVLEGSKATILPHPEMTVTMGTLIPCVLNTAMQSDAPGIVTCTTIADVRGTTGTVTLMGKGTRMVGEYGHGMQQGQERLFVLWNRAETPEHVVITLGSPGADALGVAGFGGWVDGHFWQKFGAALMLTAIDGAFSLGSSALSKNGSTNLSFSGGQNAADIALQNSINIQPTLKKNQGETVSVMVARDLDFAEVYSLSTR